jgi:hypothetical protein
MWSGGSHHVSMFLVDAFPDIGGFGENELKAFL